VESTWTKRTARDPSNQLLLSNQVPSWENSPSTTDKRLNSGVPMWLLIVRKWLVWCFPNLTIRTSSNNTACKNAPSGKSTCWLCLSSQPSLLWNYLISTPLCRYWISSKGTRCTILEVLRSPFTCAKRENYSRNDYRNLQFLQVPSGQDEVANEENHPSHPIQDLRSQDRLCVRPWGDPPGVQKKKQSCSHHQCVGLLH